jgi:hypothetical protein
LLVDEHAHPNGQRIVHPACIGDVEQLNLHDSVLPHRR